MDENTKRGYSKDSLFLYFMILLYFYKEHKLLDYKMRLAKLHIKNFKSFQDVTFHFNSDLNILTGVNNAGKTTVLEAISLWNECFGKLIRQAKKTVKNYNTGDWILGNTQIKYFRFDEINSVRSPSSDDIFYNKIKTNKIELTSVFDERGNTLEIRFKISNSGGNYVIELDNFTKYDFHAFNQFFSNFPEPVGVLYSSPVDVVPLVEQFVTTPQIKNAIKVHNSVSVIRNRLYSLYQTSRFSSFQSDLSYILYNKPNAHLRIINKSDIQQDTTIVMNFTIGSNAIEKDIALLGSGSLQIIEILLNLYQQGTEPNDFNIILLDEPDSHIHRDIQERLLEILVKFASNNQIFISTHNESLIRSAHHKHLFHLDGSSQGVFRNITHNTSTLIKGNTQSYRGIVPTNLSPIIRTFGSNTGLDFINAIESDHLFFVEGEDDARVFASLLRHITPINSKKVMFWVLGGVSKVLDDLKGYKNVFSQIKNGKNLWEKSCLIFDKDEMIDEHKNNLSTKLENKLSLKNYCLSAYTQESVLFTNLQNLSKLLVLWMNSKKTSTSFIDETEVLGKLLNSYQNVKPILQNKYNDGFIESSDCYKQYRGRYIDKASHSLQIDLFKGDDVQLVKAFKIYVNDVITKQEYYKLMNKEHVQQCINAVTTDYNIIFNVEDDYMDLISHVNKSLWFSEWDFLTTL